MLDLLKRKDVGAGREAIVNANAVSTPAGRWDVGDDGDSENEDTGMSAEAFEAFEKRLKASSRLIWKAHGIEVPHELSHDLSRRASLGPTRRKSGTRSSMLSAFAGGGESLEAKWEQLKKRIREHAQLVNAAWNGIGGKEIFRAATTSMSYENARKKKMKRIFYTAVLAFVLASGAICFYDLQDLYKVVQGHPDETSHTSMAASFTLAKPRFASGGRSDVMGPAATAAPEARPEENATILHHKAAPQLLSRYQEFSKFSVRDLAVLVIIAVGLGFGLALIQRCSAPISSTGTLHDVTEPLLG